MLTTTQVIYAIDPISGLDRWVYQPTRCAITNTVLGSGGALISQCGTAPPCDGLDFCGTSPQLLLRDATAARTDDQAHKTNPDQIKWNRIGNTAIPTSVDRLLTAVDRTTNTLEILAPRNGSVRATLPVRAGPPDTPVAQVTTSQAQSCCGSTASPTRSGSVMTGCCGRGRRVERPRVSHPSALITAVGVDGLVLLDPSTGKTTRTFPEAALFAAGARAYEFGSGFIVAESPTTVYR